MARAIYGSVGRMGGKNNTDDVITVQQLLFQVPDAHGGTKPPVEIDGLCGPKTIAAIQKFQLFHFGWKGADGRVDPNGPTLAKLNEFDKNPTAPTPLTNQTRALCSHGGVVTGKSLRGTQVLTTSDRFIVVGCPFGPSPCVRVLWNGPPGRALKVGDTGQSLNALNLSQGIVFFAYILTKTRREPRRVLNRRQSVHQAIVGFLLALPTYDNSMQRWTRAFLSPCPRPQSRGWELAE